jgi:F0F1-type ATP synthase assembly protein I
MNELAWYSLLAFCCAFSVALGFIAGTWVGLSIANLVDSTEDSE